MTQLRHVAHSVPVITYVFLIDPVPISMVVLDEYLLFKVGAVQGALTECCICTETCLGSVF